MNNIINLMASSIISSNQSNNRRYKPVSNTPDTKKEPQSTGKGKPRLELKVEKEFKGWDHIGLKPII